MLEKLAKRLSDKQKTIIVKYFVEGKAIDQLAKEFDCTKSTIIRNLKRNLGEEKYQDLISMSKKINKTVIEKEKNNFFENNNPNSNNYFKSENNEYLEELIPITAFTEITPLNFEIENQVQKDLSSVPISEVDFPNIVYMIVDKKIELDIKYLKEYPDWQFLSQEELNRKTIEIYFDLKIAKRVCTKEQKVIKVPNTDVFKIVAPLLLNKGISRIVTADKLIAL
tara:strand:- start:1691 stop:2362 length:672 start_codon:yes stop_codon:yes gene_type:complete